MPNRLGITFDQCVSRFSSVSSIDDAEAFCGSLESLIGLGKAMTLKRDAVAVICPPCAEQMAELGVGVIKVGGKNPIPTQLSKHLHRMAGGFHVKLPIVKISASDGLVTGWASIITDAEGAPIIDFDLDIIPIAELEKAAQRAFTRDSGKGMAGDMHEVQGVADVVESFVVSKAKREALGFGEGPEGWIVTLKINDPDLLKQIESGEKTELSIRGAAKRVPVDGAPGVGILTDLDFSVVELLSVVDAGASGDVNHRPAIVLVKRKVGRKPKGMGVLAKLKRMMRLKSLRSLKAVRKDRALGEMIETLNAAADWDVNDLAEFSGVPVETLAQIISGEVEPSKDQIASIANAFEVSVEELTGTTSEDPAVADSKTIESVLAAMDEESKTVVMAALEAAAKDEHEDDEEDEETAKALAKLPAALRKLITDGAEAKAEVIKLRDETELAKCVAKAAEMPHLGGASHDELGAVLKAAKGLPTKEQRTLEAVLLSANKAAELSAIYLENGTKRAQPDSAQAEFEAVVEKLQTDDAEIKVIKSATGRKAAAMRKAAETHQDLYKRMRSEAN